MHLEAGPPVEEADCHCQGDHQCHLSLIKEGTHFSTQVRIFDYYNTAITMW